MAPVCADAMPTLERELGDPAVENPEAQSSLRTDLASGTARKTCGPLTHKRRFPDSARSDRQAGGANLPSCAHERHTEWPRPVQGSAAAQQYGSAEVLEVR